MPKISKIMPIAFGIIRKEARQIKKLTQKRNSLTYECNPCHCSNKTTTDLNKRLENIDNELHIAQDRFDRRYTTCTGNKKELSVSKITRATQQYLRKKN